MRSTRETFCEALYEELANLAKKLSELGAEGSGATRVESRAWILTTPVVFWFLD